jgi:hypothetical protein
MGRMVSRTYGGTFQVLNLTLIAFINPSRPSRMAYFLGSAALYILFFKLWKKYTSPIKDGGTAKRQQVLTFLAVSKRTHYRL